MGISFASECLYLCLCLYKAPVDKLWRWKGWKKGCRERWNSPVWGVCAYSFLGASWVPRMEVRACSHGGNIQLLVLWGPGLLCKVLEYFYSFFLCLVSVWCLSGDNLFSAPKLSQSFANSDLGHLWHSSDSNHLPVPETLRSTSYSKPLPAVPNTTAHSFHSDPSPNTPSEGCSESSTSSKGNPETSSDSVPSDLNSGLMFFRNSLSYSGDRATPVASNIKGQVIKVIRDVKGWWWSGSMGNAGQWPWS